MEVLSHVSHNRDPNQPDRMFTLDTIAEGPTIRSASGSCLTVQVDKLLEQAFKQINEYDILVVPGGNSLRVGAAGVLGGMTVTTHHRAVDELRDVCDRFNTHGSAHVVHKRYIDGGLLKGEAVQLLSAGGISSGLDASLHLVRQLTDPAMAAFVSRVMEYDWSEQSK
ncbi:uncharacterized protein N7477_007352 [Penicillium maclennaniae]|uniref:uncharacterized protein n=1 Tax=Penicillium maclennaniae TaxID=1343394 RepID=UPI002541A881|nr:uncharacterized protein N7477_007352 [Penicillium maclennaniae]KAJ5664904.1 hypothetical protein N7477_007352 [Penicillium maclennaniae]